MYLGNMHGRLQLLCTHCGWHLPDEMKMGNAVLHFQVEHDTNEVKVDLIPICVCGARMELVESRPTGGGFKDYFGCKSCHSTGYVKRLPELATGV